MRRTTILMLWVGVLNGAGLCAGDLTAEQTLARVSEAYRNLKSFHFVVGKEPWTGELSGLSPGRIRLRAPALLLVSNGENTWTYLPDLNEYTEVAAAPLYQEDWDASRSLWLSSDVFWSTLRPLRYEWTGLPQQKGHPKLRGAETLKVGEKEVECYVATCSIDGLPHRLWVDKTSFIVWRDEWLTPPDRSGAGLEMYPVAGRVSSWELKDADLGSIPDPTFEFAPPQGAERVESFRPPKGHGQYELERAAYSLMGVDIERKAKGKKAPDFAARDLDGKVVRLADLAGKIVVLVFWASWCEPCQKELSDVEKLRNQLVHQDVIFLGIDDEDAETMKNFLKANAYSFPTLFDSDRSVHQLYAVRWVPYVVSIDGKGKVASRDVGAQGDPGLRRAIEAAGLNKGSASRPR